MRLRRKARRHRIPAAPALLICLSWALILTGRQATAAGAKFPTNLVISPKASPHHVLLVEKASQRLFVYRFDGDYRLVATYPCATGENPGDKQVSGDRKTPEGVYFFTKAVDEKYLSPIYGARAFPMNYPNLMDQRQRKAGAGIWVHGTNEELKERSTNGCIALDNKDIVRLDSYIKLWDTPIIVEEKIEYEDRSSLRRLGRLLLERIEGWREAWSNKDLHSYLSHYASAFTWRTLDLQGWRQKKERLNRLYRIISVQISDIRLYRQGHVVTASFEEIYRSNRFASHGFKRLYLVQNSKEWRIVGEEWRKSDRPGPPPLQLAADEPPTPAESAEASLSRFLQEWRHAWEQGNLPDYMAYYHPEFKTRDMDFNAWKLYKHRLFAKSSGRTIQISDVRMEIKGKTAIVVFNQHYRTDRHQDYGKKTLRLRRHNGQWTILKETWVPLG